VHGGLPIDVPVKGLSGRRAIDNLAAADFDQSVAAQRVKTGGFGIEEGCALETGFTHRSSMEGERFVGVHCRRISLNSERFAMIDDRLGFQLVPWRPALEQQLGRQVAGIMQSKGAVDWSLGRKRGLGLEVESLRLRRQEVDASYSFIIGSASN
jgi:hypothetical protein